MSLLERPRESTPAPRGGRKRAVLLGRAPQDTPAGFWTYLFLAVSALFAAFPLYWMFVISTSTDEATSQLPPVVLPGDQFLVNLDEVFSLQDVYFAASLVNSVIVSGVVTASVLFFCSLAGFAFAKLRFRGSKPLMLFVILTLTVPNQLGVVALYIVMGKLGWNGTLLAVIVPGLVTAFGVFYMRQFIVNTVPDELVESARVDGATTMRIYWNIVLPAVRPALAVLGLLTFVATWNDFQWPLITLNGTDYPTSMVAISDLASGNYVIYRRVLAGAFVATLPLLVVLIIGGRRIVRGIMEGAVKS
ncbi:cellobiose transport system permease protein [Micromonospora phaseoli]|uniref:Cellobiose transport system permease protein n=1 Tax=Micromonospora phaseoli TaxID=1144548 RepID=A0A1H6RBB8_9ACTN|nr:carbohydrate ABC transporter permease [Micromonospora phaseoli]PZW03345.1 cellobiose transport system permease protein [Micromonospora phaseoli]GIJ78320.1 sugar ABC transporter permease [Micromonospora phaseoli]SEI51776.1 cellobiose transport system permease protein [Micromonospora phaseoli]